MTKEEHGRHSAAVAASHSEQADPKTPSKRSKELTASTLSRSNSSSRYAAKRRRARGKSIVLGILIAVVGLLIVGAGVAWAYINNLDRNLSHGVDDELRAVLTERAEPDDPFYMLLLGVDKGEGREEEWGDEYWNFRADTIILARIDPVNVKVTLVSIPRDTYVVLGENGPNKINAAYTFGGASYMVQVVQDFAGVPISHYAEIDFSGFEAVVDGVGGIDVTLPVAISDPEFTGLELDAGTHHLGGHDALMLARSRHAYDDYGGGDFFRAANQRMVVSAVVRKVLDSNIVTMSSTISKLAECVTTDMSASDIISLAMQMRSLDIDKNFYSGQEPTISEFFDELWYEMPDEEAWARMMERVDQGLPPYADADDDFTAGIAGTISQNPSYANDEEKEDVTQDVEAEYSGTVLVLNAAGVDGLAGEVSGTLTRAGFEATADTANSINGRTVIFYNGDGALAKAKGASEAMGGVSVEANDGTYSTDYDLVVLLGTDNRY